MQVKHLTLIILSLIILIGTYLRLVDLEIKPNGFYVDEASTGYNAWSILQTGKDEYGKSFPIFFRFLGSYTPPLYTYLTALSVKIFGLSIFSTRLVSALSGIILILVVFLFIRSLRLTNNFSTLIAVFLFTISPWAIFYSRIGYEINLAFLLFSLGVLFLSLSLKRPVYLILGSILLAVSTYAYHTERLLALLTLFVFLTIYRKLFFKSANRKILAFSFILLLLILIPQIMLIHTPSSSSRGLGLFYQQAVARQTKQLNILPQLLSLPLVVSHEFSAQYLSYFSPRNLFFQPDSDPQRSLPDLSNFYPWMVILYLVGLFSLSKMWKEKGTKFLFMLLILVPIPAALAGDPFSSQRSLPLLLPLTVILAIGVDRILNFKFKLSLAVFSILSLISLLYLYRSYSVLLPNERAKIWGYGYKELAAEIKKRPNEKFLIDTSRVKPAYIELAFFLKFPPDKFQETVNRKIKANYYNDVKWDDYYLFGQVETRAIDFQKDIYKDQILVGDELAISETQAKEHFLTQVFEIKSPADEIIFQGFRTNPQLKCSKTADINRCKDI